MSVLAYLNTFETNPRSYFWPANTDQRNFKDTYY